MNEKAKCKNCTDEMIEEMAKDLEMVEKEAFSKIAKETQLYVKEHHRYNSKEDYSLAHTKTIYELVAEALIKLGYTKNKIPEGSVVLTREEHMQMLKDCIESNKVVEERTRKETAKEIINMLIPDCQYCDEDWHSGCLCLRGTIAEKITNKYGVEVEE
jgi:hypothetical protein